MSYTTTNEINHFIYDEAILREINPGLSEIHLILDDVKITPENSQNRDIRTMRTNNLDFAINDFRIVSVTEEGYSVADADGNVYETVPDRLLPSEEYNDAFALLSGMYIDGIEKTDDQYIISLRGEDHTWKLVLHGSGDTQKWDRFIV